MDLFPTLLVIFIISIANRVSVNCSIKERVYPFSDKIIWNQGEQKLLIDDQDGYFSTLCPSEASSDLNCTIYKWDPVEEHLQKCDLNRKNFFGSDGRFIQVVSVNFFGFRRALLEIHEVGQTRDRWTVAIFDMKDCNYTTIGFGEYKPHLAIYGSLTFDYISSNQKQCFIEDPSGRRCRNSLNSELVPFAQQPFEINLNDMAIDALDGRLSAYLLIRGYDPVDEKYKLKIMDVYGKVTDLLVEDPPIEMVTYSDGYLIRSTYLICRMVSQGDKHTKVVCNKFDEDFNQKLNVTINIPESVTLIGVRNVEFHHHHTIALLTQRKNCTGDACWKLLVTKADLKEVKTIEVPFDCSSDPKKLTFGAFMSESSLGISYHCEYTDDGLKSRLRSKAKTLTDLKISKEHFDSSDDKS